jgi:hypothetical protein
MSIQEYAEVNSVDVSENKIGHVDLYAQDIYCRNLNVLNPFNILQSFLSGGTPPCQELTMETVDVNNNKSSETHYVTLVDIGNMDPCSFSDKTNPQSGNKCKETFTSLNESEEFIR